MSTELYSTSYFALSSLAAYYRLEGNANDSKSINNGGLQGSPTLVTGKFGNAYQFNGSSSYISIVDDPSLRVTGTLTLHGWIKTNAAIGATSVFFGKGKLDTDADADYALYISSTGKLHFVQSNGSADQESVSTASVDDGNWHMIDGVYTPSTSMITYIDGKQDGINTTSINAAIQSTTHNLAMGRDGTASTRFLNAAVDDMAIFNIALTAGQIADLYFGHTNYLANYRASTGGRLSFGS